MDPAPAFLTSDVFWQAVGALAFSFCMLGLVTQLFGYVIRWPSRFMSSDVGAYTGEEQ